MIYAIANQKGGVGKTTTAVNLAACVAEAAYETLLVDLDPQCNATVGLGLAKDLEPNAYDVLSGEAELEDAIHPVPGIPHLHVAPSTPDLAGANVELPRMAGSETLLRERLAQDVEREVRAHFPDLVFSTVIPRNVRLGEAPSFGRPVIHHDPHCAGSDAYFELAKEVAARG